MDQRMLYHANKLFKRRKLFPDTTYADYRIGSLASGPQITFPGYNTSKPMIASKTTCAKVR